MKTYFKILFLILLAGCSNSESEPASREANILSFEIVGLPFSSTTINPDSKTIEIVVTFGSDVTRLAANFSLSDKASAEVNGIIQVSGETTNNFSDPIVYKVRAEDLTVIEWTVIVTRLDEQPVVGRLASLPSNGGIAVKSDGTVFSASETDRIYKISSSGEISTFLSGDPNVTRATMLVFDKTEKYLYVSNTPVTQQGWITKIDVDGFSKIFASGFNLPTGITFDDAGNLYVAEQNNIIWKVNSVGDKTIWVQNSSFNRPHGLAWANGNIYVASAHDGNVFKVPTSGTLDLTLFAHVNGLQQQWAAGYMMYANDNLYITNGDNKIHQISLEGIVSDYAGTGADGSTNGPASYARFSAPNGIGGDSNGKKIYVGEYNANSIRIIQN